MDANQLLMGGGVASAKFETPGTSVTGQIVREPEARQQTDYKTGTPQIWPSGDPKMQVIVHIQTGQRDPGDATDDGVRAIYIKGKSLTEAVREAVRTSGARGLEVGGTLTVTYTGDGKKEGNLNPPKLYTATYTRPTAAAANNVLMGQPVVAVDAPAPAGVDAEMWARLDHEQRAKVAAAVGVAPPF